MGVAFHLAKLGGPTRKPLIHSRTVTEPVRYVASALWRSPSPRVFRVRGTDLQVLLRLDNDEDGFILSEVFGSVASYSLPPEVAALDGVRKVVDLGANIGITALKLLLAFPEAHLTGVEADPANVALCEANLALNGLSHRAEVLSAVAAAHAGVVGFVGGQAGRSHIAADGEAGAVETAAIDVLPMLDDADVLKLDIEGGEWPILNDPRLAASGLRAMCMEYHRHLCPAADHHVEARRLLRRAGFRILVDTSSDDVGFLWASRVREGGRT